MHCETFMVDGEPVVVTLREELTAEERPVLQAFLEDMCRAGWKNAQKAPGD